MISDVGDGGSSIHLKVTKSLRWKTKQRTKISWMNREKFLFSTIFVFTSIVSEILFLFFSHPRYRIIYISCKRYNNTHSLDTEVFTFINFLLEPTIMGYYRLSFHLIVLIFPSLIFFNSNIWSFTVDCKLFFASPKTDQFFT